MEQPEGFKKLLKDFDPRNLNKMPAAEVIKAFSLLRDLATEMDNLDSHVHYWSYGKRRPEDMTCLKSTLKRYKEWE